MNVSPSTQPSAPQPPQRGARLAENPRRLPMRVPVDPVDPDEAAVFRALLCERDGRQPDARVERFHPRVGMDLPERRSEREDDIGRVTRRQADLERQEDMSTEDASLAPRDLGALAAMVTKVYLDALHDERRTIGIALNEDLLPATRLSVQERGGRLAVDFVSMNACARDRLRRGAAALANRIAADLSRDVAVKVAAHDGDRQPLEVHADAAPAPRRESMA
ncbi:hypothetical protein CAL26_20920 [Bordetella genomosp. 9]|uniref:Uncharacterized protein n=1 Tax=Bordetella genomosp. 9 TaxID=1416803 RepID=A0A261R4S1_9BORD|nr:hypothetical protein [Bordetella genomosp. 9]OZI20018.1 hypothetical protein CAL26_20920 [Bordetella genomosp. 9]